MLDNDERSGNDAKKISRPKRWTWCDISNAITDVRECGISIRKAAIFHGMPKLSLTDRISGKIRGNPSGGAVSEKKSKEEVEGASKVQTDPCFDQVE